MKKVIAIILVLSLVLSLSACGGSETETTVPTVTPTTTPTVSPTTAPTVTPTETPEVEEETSVSDWVSLPAGAVGGSSETVIEYISWDGSSALSGDGYYTYDGESDLTASPTFTGTIVFDEDVAFASETTLDMPNAHVEFYGEAGTLTVSTSATTFEVKSGAKITTLKIDAGNALVEGDVSKIEILSTNTTGTTVTTASSSSPVIENSATGTVVVITESSTPTIVATTSATYVKNETTSNISASTSASGESSEVESTNKTDTIIVLEGSGGDTTVGSTVLDETAKTALETLQSALDADGASTVVMTESVIIALGETLTIPAGVVLDYATNSVALTNYGTIAVCDADGFVSAFSIGGEIKLVNSFTVYRNNMTIGTNSVILSVTKNTTIDLNGKTLTFDTTTGATDEDATRFVIPSETSGVSLIIKNGSIIATAVASTAEDKETLSVFILSNTSLTLDSVYYETIQSAIYAGENAVVKVLNDSYIKAPVYTVATNASQEASKQVKLYYIDSTFETTADDAATIFLNSTEALYVSNCVAITNNIGVFIRAGSADINGLDVIYNLTRDYDWDEYLNDGIWGSGTWVPSTAILIGNQAGNTSYQNPASVTLSNISITLNTGAYDCDEFIAVYTEGSNSSNTATVTLKDAFTISEDWQVAIGENATLTIEGTLVNEGTIVNNGTINYDGVFENNGRVEGDEVEKFATFSANFTSNVYNEYEVSNFAYMYDSETASYVENTDGNYVKVGVTYASDASGNDSMSFAMSDVYYYIGNIGTQTVAEITINGNSYSTVESGTCSVGNSVQITDPYAVVDEDGNVWVSIYVLGFELNGNSAVIGAGNAVFDLTFFENAAGLTLTAENITYSSDITTGTYTTDEYGNNVMSISAPSSATGNSSWIKVTLQNGEKSLLGAGTYTVFRKRVYEDGSFTFGIDTSTAAQTYMIYPCYGQTGEFKTTHVYTLFVVGEGTITFTLNISLVDSAT